MVEWLLPFGLPERQWRHFISRIGDRSTVQCGYNEAGQYGCGYNRPSGEIADHVNLKERFQELTLSRERNVAYNRLYRHSYLERVATASAVVNILIRIRK